MSEAERATDPDGRFTLRPPPGWSAAPDDDESGGLEVWREEGAGTLHLVSFEGEGFADPAEELYAFMEDRGVELEDDDVEDLVLEAEGEMAIAEFETEDEEEGETTFWLVGVAAAPGTLVFATYLAPAGEQEAEVEQVRQSLATLRLRSAPSDNQP
jgi:hypothetical protein